MIHLLQDTTSIRYTDGRKINLQLLKNQIDRKMLKIQMLAERIPLSDVTPLNHNQPLTNQNQAEKEIQTEVTPSEPAYHQNEQIKPLKENMRPTFELQPKERRPRITYCERKPLSIKENDFLICAQEDHKIQEGQLQIEETAIDLVKVPAVQFLPYFHRREQSEYIPQISPIYKDKFKETDRSMKIKVKTQRTFISKLGQQFEPFIVSEECKSKMEQIVRGLGGKTRKEATDHNLRSNILKKVKQRYMGKNQTHY